MIERQINSLSFSAQYTPRVPSIGYEEMCWSYQNYISRTPCVLGNRFGKGRPTNIVEINCSFLAFYLLVHYPEGIIQCWLVLLFLIILEIC